MGTFLVIMEIILAASLIGAVIVIRRLARKDKAAEDKKFGKD